MLIGLTGYAQSGKDTVAKSLHLRGGFLRMAFADNLKNLAGRLDPIIEVSYKDDFLYLPLQAILVSNTWDEAKKIPHVRQFLQNLGNEAREVLGENVWVDAVKDQLMTYIGEGKNVVFTDVRYPNEASLIKSWGGTMVRVMRPGVKALNEHVTEVGLDNLPVDDIIVNDGTINELGSKVSDLLRKLGA